MLTTMTLKRLASLGGSDDPMAAAGAARRDAAARTLGRGEEGEGFWRREVEGGLCNGRRRGARPLRPQGTLPRLFGRWKEG